MPLFNPATIPQEDWIAPALLGTWLNYDSSHNSAGYWKDSMGIVHLRGLIKSGTINTAVFTLPAGYRPERREVLCALSSTGSGVTLGRLSVETNGSVIPMVGATAWFSLDGATFRAL